MRGSTLTVGTWNVQHATDESEGQIAATLAESGIMKLFQRRAVRAVLGRRWLRTEHGDDPTSEEYKKDGKEVQKLMENYLKLSISFQKTF